MGGVWQKTRRRRGGGGVTPLSLLWSRACLCVCKELYVSLSFCSFFWGGDDGAALRGGPTPRVRYAS